MPDLIRVLICGVGNGAHALAGILSTKPNIEVRVLTQDAGRAQLWTNLLKSDQLTVSVRQGNGEYIKYCSTAFSVLNEPRQAAHGCDLIILAAPAFLHRSYLTALAPYIEDGCTIVGLPGQTGFEFDVREILGQKLQECILMNFDSLPWICRITEFGKSVRITGTKKYLSGALQGDLSKARLTNPVSILQHLLGDHPVLTVSGHLLGITLRSVNAYSHPPIVYGRWHDWSGFALESPPLFYEEIDEATASLLDDISREVIATSTRIASSYPEADLSQVIPMYEWDLRCYGDSIKDTSNLMMALRTNPAYEGIKHPMIKIQDNQYVPDFNHRFLAEDVPFGLVAIRSIAEIADVETPCIDKVLLWCQSKLNREYLVGTKLIGKDLVNTRCAYRYGLRTVADLLGYAPLRKHASEGN